MPFVDAVRCRWLSTTGNAATTESVPSHAGQQPEIAER
jgi:hypothetical protein